MLNLGSLEILKIEQGRLPLSEVEEIYPGVKAIWYSS